MNFNGKMIVKGVKKRTMLVGK